MLKVTPVAKRLGITPQTLRHWSKAGLGPEYVRIGKLFLYSPAAVDRWLAEHTH